jgi:ceramide glucosyltransferase
MTEADWILGLFLLLAAGLHFGSIAIVIGRFHRARAPLPLPDELPPISVVRPACGLENHIEETLESGLRLDYPTYEVIFCVQRPEDPIIPVIRKLIAAHPQVPAKLLIGDDRISINPKLNNCVKGWDAAEHDWIVMTDSNVLMPADYLKRLISRAGPDVALVCSAPVGDRPDGLWAELEAAFLNSYQARWQLTADSVGMGFAQGKTLFWRRSVLDRAGGIRALGSESAEDAASTKIVRDAGLKVRLVEALSVQPLGQRTFDEVWQRQLRWARLRKVCFKAFFVPELFAGGFLPIAAAAALAIVNDVPLALVAMFAIVWYGAETLMAKVAGWTLSVRAPLVWILRDIMLVPLWIGAVSGNAFVWRGTAMDLTEMERRPVRFRWRHLVKREAEAEVD